VGYKRILKSSITSKERFAGKHRFEHWYADNQVYFITGCCRDHFPAFASDAAKAVFWAKLHEYAARYGFFPWACSLMANHYHLLGYNRTAEGVRSMMQRLHGSVAKLVNDLLRERRADFWRDQRGREYFDGCIRDERQARLAHAYTLRQAVKARLVRDHRDYPHTRVFLDLDRCICRAHELGAFLEGVPYTRYCRDIAG